MVTAYTHSAIDVVVDKLLTHLQTSRTENQTNIIRIQNKGETSKQREGIIYANPDKRFDRIFDNHKDSKRSAIICGSVWQLQKFENGLPASVLAERMICIEEASLLPMIETSVALSLLPLPCNNGDVLMIGDNLQLGTLSHDRRSIDIKQYLNESLFNYLVETATNLPTPLSLTQTWRLNSTMATFLRQHIGYTSYKPANNTIGDQNLLQHLGPDPSANYISNKMKHFDNIMQGVLHPCQPIVLIVFW